MTTEQQTTPAPMFLDTLVERLGTRPELQGVTILSAPGTAGDESIVFTDIEETGQWGALGRMRTEHTITLNGEVFVTRKGAGDDIATAARLRAYAIFAELERELVATQEGNQQFTIHTGRPTALTSRIVTRNLRQGVNPEGHGALIEFTIEALGHSTR